MSKSPALLAGQTKIKTGRSCGPRVGSGLAVKLEGECEMASVPRSGEGIARFIDRRVFMKKAAIAIFSAAAATAIGFDLKGIVLASGYCPVNDIESGSQACAFGRTCSGCPGGTYGCPTNCSPDRSQHNPDNCWCTAQFYFGSSLVYYVCCDCQCSGQFCGCATLFGP